MTQAPLDLKTLNLKDYPLITYDKIRYSDTDRQGHVNNAVFACFLETGRVELLYDPANPLAAPGCSFVIASLTLSLLAELRWPGIADIGTAIQRIGNSSISICQGLYQNGILVATAETVIVQSNNDTKRSQALTEVTKTALAKFQIRSK